MKVILEDRTGNQREIAWKLWLTLLLLAICATFGWHAWRDHQDSQPRWIKAGSDITHKSVAEYWERYPNKTAHAADQPDAFWLKHKKTGTIETGPLSNGEWHGQVTLWQSPNRWRHSTFRYGRRCGMISAPGKSVVETWKDRPTFAERASFHPMTMPTGTIVAITLEDAETLMDAPTRQ